MRRRPQLPGMSAAAFGATLSTSDRYRPTQTLDQVMAATRAVAFAEDTLRDISPLPGMKPDAFVRAQISEVEAALAQVRRIAAAGTAAQESP